MERINPEQIGGIFCNQSIRQRETFLKIAMQRTVCSRFDNPVYKW